MNFRIGFIGCGNLAQALILGILKKRILKANQLFAIDKQSRKLAAFRKQTKIQTPADLADLVIHTNIVFLATKPQDLPLVLKSLNPLLTQKHTVVSLAAGVPADLLRAELWKARTIIRVMGNTPASIQCGLFGIFLVKGRNRDLTDVENLFNKIGTTIRLHSDLHVNAMTAASASGVGFVFYLMQGFYDWLLNQGFNALSARRIAVETFSGASSLARYRVRESFSDLLGAVASKKGTTEAGLKSMKSKKLNKSLKAGLQAAYSRSLSISKSLRHRSK